METQAAWYPAPGETGMLRYWDGGRWTEHRASATSAPPLVGITQFTVKHRMSLRHNYNYYELRPLMPDGVQGEIIAVAWQKRMTLPEEFLFSADARGSVPILSFKARTHLNFVNAMYDVLDAQGVPIGHLRYEWLESNLRSTWSLGAAGVQAEGHQADEAVGVARRQFQLQGAPLGLITMPFLFDFQFRDATGRLVLRSERRPAMRDRYVVTVPGAVLDGRVAAAMAVALDGLYGR